MRITTVLTAQPRFCGLFCSLRWRRSPFFPLWYTWRLSSGTPPPHLSACSGILSVLHLSFTTTSYVRSSFYHAIQADTCSAPICHWPFWQHPLPPPYLDPCSTSLLHPFGHYYRWLTHHSIVHGSAGRSRGQCFLSTWFAWRPWAILSWVIHERRCMLGSGAHLVFSVHRVSCSPVRIFSDVRLHHITMECYSYVRVSLHVWLSRALPAAFSCQPLRQVNGTGTSKRCLCSYVHLHSAPTHTQFFCLPSLIFAR